MKKAVYIVIIGCGRLGAILATSLSQQGHEVVVIDKNPSAFSALTEEFSGFTLTGNAAEMNILEAAKLERSLLTTDKYVCLAVFGSLYRW